MRPGMHPHPLVTLTTDFEEREPGAAILKGVIASHCDSARILDLGHDIPRGDVMSGALFLAAAVPAFPRGTIHLADVAPAPVSIAVIVGGQTLVCSDNGLITLLADQLSIEAAYRIQSAEVRPGELRHVSFGRDVLAPAAGQLAGGKPLTAFGPAVDPATLVRLSVAKPARLRPDFIAGEIMHVDRFGNLMSNIHASMLQGLRVVRVDVGDFPINALSRSYTDVPPGKPLAIIGSSGYLEAAYNGDRADRRLEVGKGIAFKVTVAPA